jgi:hypothetical protein
VRARRSSSSTSSRSGSEKGGFRLASTASHPSHHVDSHALSTTVTTHLLPILPPRSSRWDALIPATAAFATGALFTLPRAVTMRGIEAQYVSLPKRLAVMSLGGLATTAGVAALSVVGPFVFGHRSPFRFASS